MNLYKNYLDKTKEYGVVEQIEYPIIYASGLPAVKREELVVFEAGQLGQVMNLSKNLVEILLFSPRLVKIGTKVARSSEAVAVAVGQKILGSVIDPLGLPLWPAPIPVKSGSNMPIYGFPPPLISRVKIKRPLFSGTTVVDMLLPLGKGQRQLIAGDRKAGKTSFLMTLAKLQAKEGNVVIFALIGKKKSEIKAVKMFLENEKISQNCVIVATSSDNSPGLISLTPFTAMTVAESFKKDGLDSVVILDDLTTHAHFYREIALVGKRFPGRESYPGDIFYTHAKLLERAGNFKYQEREVAITALPVVETVENDFTSLVVSNLIGITDGHLLFDSRIKDLGRSPAIDIFLSVTRVGKQTKDPSSRELGFKLMAFLSQVEKLQNLAQFGPELLEKTKQDLEKADRIYKLFNQSLYQVIPQEKQLKELLQIWGKP
ncbi:hypothetical protein HYW41_00950 [Candidatus Daviesbacteria bacterium]|nr:hypothetical protein [Candidatus Daviesbacteria bacterium]